MVHSGVINSGLSSVELKKIDFRFFFLNFFQEEEDRHFTSELSTFFSRTQIFGKFIGVWGLLHQCGTTGAQCTGTFLLNLGLRKMCLKLLTLNLLKLDKNSQFAHAVLMVVLRR